MQPALSPRLARAFKLQWPAPVHHYTLRNYLTLILAVSPNGLFLPGNAIPYMKCRRQVDDLRRGPDRRQ